MAHSAAQKAHEWFAGTRALGSHVAHLKAIGALGVGAGSCHRIPIRIVQPPLLAMCCKITVG